MLIVRDYTSRGVATSTDDDNPPAAAAAAAAADDDDDDDGGGEHAENDRNSRLEICANLFLG